MVCTVAQRTLALLDSSRMNIKRERERKKATQTTARSSRFRSQSANAQFLLAGLLLYAKSKSLFRQLTMLFTTVIDIGRLRTKAVVINVGQPDDQQAHVQVKQVSGA